MPDHKHDIEAASLVVGLIESDGGAASTRAGPSLDCYIGVRVFRWLGLAFQNPAKMIFESPYERFIGVRP